MRYFSNKFFKNR